jgi:hypothetical protein
MDVSLFKQGRKRNKAQRLWRRNRTFADVIDSGRLLPINSKASPFDTSESISAESVNPYLFGAAESSSDDQPVPELINVDEILEIDSSSSSSDNTDLEDIVLDLDDDTPLYRHSPMSLHKSAISIIRFCRKVKLNKRSVEHFLATVHDLLPMSNRLPRTLSGLLRQAGIVPLQMRPLPFLSVYDTFEQCQCWCQ